MDYLDKPPRKKAWFLFKCIIVPLLIGVCLILTGEMVKQANRYLRVEQDPLALDVVISYVDVDYDTENGDDYNAMVVYTCSGVKYERVYRTFSNEREARELVGRTVTILVDPESPGDMLERIGESGKSYLLFACIFLYIAVLCLNIRHRPTYVETHGWRREAVKKDILRNLRYAPGDFILVPIVYFYAAAAFYPRLYLQPSVGDMIALAVALVALSAGFSKRSRLKKAKNDAIILRRDIFVSKDVIPDTDGPDTYTVTYENERSRWTRQVPQKVYEAASEGDVIESAYLEGETKPVLNHTVHGESFWKRQSQPIVDSRLVAISGNPG